MGMGWPAPKASEASRVTLGSAPRNAERRNLKRPSETSWSVKSRRTLFWSFRASKIGVLAAFLQCKRLAIATGSRFTMMSTSGTATAKAAARVSSLLAKPKTSASGAVLDSTLRTSATSLCTVESDSLVGVMRPRSSRTSSSQPVAWKVGLCTGCELGCLYSQALCRSNKRGTLLATCLAAGGGAPRRGGVALRSNGPDDNLGSSVSDIFFLSGRPWRSKGTRVACRSM
mmetsp:Transcript_41221/g.116644  ORF Transcript_41221/g.116644 Transcript_41221/m.116644 type:complete len:229 (-) Transcript_41221:278-964(-)